MVYRVYKVLSDVTRAHLGGSSMSVTVSGVANFAHNLSVMQQHCGHAMLILRDADPGMRADSRGELLEGPMKQAEAYIAKRRATHWSAQ